MKIKLLVLLLLSSVGTYAQQIQWMSLSEALEAQKKEPKKIIMDVYTKWCGPCKLLDKKTFANPDLARYVSEHFYAVKFNAEGDEPIRFYDQNYVNPNYDERKKGRNATHQFTQFLGVRGYPTMVFFSEDGDPIMPVVGYYTLFRVGYIPYFPDRFGGWYPGTLFGVLLFFLECEELGCFRNSIAC